MLNYDETKPLIALIVPTGIGASVGGYAGDASLTAKMFAKDFNVIVNPNVVNAACFSGISQNMHYIEGYLLNEFFKGKICFKTSVNNKIGIIFDKAISKDILNVHINTVNAVKTIYGVNVVDYIITKEEAGVNFYNTSSGASTGGVKNNKTIVEAGKKLIEKGVNQIAVVLKFDEPPEDNYKSGEGVDIIGGVEAVVSHYLTRELGVMCVHAPAFENIDIERELVDKRAAAEYITPTFLPCLLLGLQNAPLFSYKNVEQYISIKNLKALIMPYNSLGSSIVSDALERNIKVFAVKQNKTILNITKDILKKNDIIEIETYEKCYLKLKELLYEKI